MSGSQILRSAAILSILSAALPAAAAETMPESFVYLRDVDPSIRQDIRYAGPANFTLRPVHGYEAAECVLVRQAAEALKAAQEELKREGLSLKVYDCYRPARAVEAFVAWAKEPDDPRAKQAYYPNLSKKALFPDYIATRSGHSRGATVDVTLVPLDGSARADASPGAADCTEANAADSIDMGVGFDCFDKRANSDAPGLTQQQRRNRARLLQVMTAHGFHNYPKEIWHYTFKPEPYPNTYFDFPILPRSGSGGEGG